MKERPAGNELLSFPSESTILPFAEHEEQGRSIRIRKVVSAETLGSQRHSAKEVAPREPLTCALLPERLRRAMFRRKPKRHLGDCLARLFLWARALGRPCSLRPRTIFLPGCDFKRLGGAGARNSERFLEETFSSWQLRVEPVNYENNRVNNQRYSLLTFLPYTVFLQFRYFFNFFYLLVGVLQLAPQFQIGPLFTYLAPLGFVITASLTKEAIDDFKRYRRDREINGQMFEVVAPFAAEAPRDQDCVTAFLPAKDLRVGHLLKLHAGQRVPCDGLLLKTLGECADAGTTFVRTDQLDGETDWKLRRAVGTTQHLSMEALCQLDASLEIEGPSKEIYQFYGSISAERGEQERTVREALSLDHTLWTNSVVTSGPVLMLSIFTGHETRAAMHKSVARSKFGKFETEINRTSKFLCAVLFVFALLLTVARPLNPLSSVYFVRFVLLLSSIIPISLRVNLDMAKVLHCFWISRDREMPGTVARNSNIPEELGCLDVLFSDKTGTITKNKMFLQRIAVNGRVVAVNVESSLKALTQEFRQALTGSLEGGGGQELSLFQSTTYSGPSSSSSLARRVAGQLRVLSFLGAVALCHSVMLTQKEGGEWGELEYQASSPDEMSLVAFSAQAVGLRLEQRSDVAMRLRVCDGGVALEYEILEVFQFTSARKRMGLVLRELSSGKVVFLLKGADQAVMGKLRLRPQWLVEEIDNFSRNGLRVLVYALKELSGEKYEQFAAEFVEAKTSLVDRELRCEQVMEKWLEQDMELLGVTGVEDELQEEVAETIESLAQAGVKLWMLTGDKLETALCIATSSGFKARNDDVYVLQAQSLKDVHDAFRSLFGILGDGVEAVGSVSAAPYVLCLDGGTLDLVLGAADPALAAQFLALSLRCKSVLCCRCSPTQKAQVLELFKQHFPELRLAAIGDGGNDVPMIQAAHCGIGIVGLEGRQASLASDFSIREFKHLKRLVLWHGRIAYQRSVKLTSFVVHRGLIISAIQVIFSSLFYFTPLALFQGWLQVGYSTYYTMCPVFSLILDVDLPPSVAFLFPELYRSQNKSGTLNDQVFFRILFKSIYQGAAVMLGALALFERQLMNLVAVAFTALILSELLNVVSEIITWHWIMVAAECLSVVIYSVSIIFLPEYFDLNFITTSDFWSKVAIITLASWLPVHSYKAIKKLLSPPQYSKLLS